MLRLLATFAVGLVLLVGVGAWFDPEGAREAIRRDLASVAGQAVRHVGDAVRAAVKQGAMGAPPRPSIAPESEPAAGPRTGKKRPPVIAEAPAGVAARPVDGVEEVQIVAPTEFAEAPLRASRESATVSSHGSVAPDLESTARDVGEQGLLIRRMLALYERVSEGR